MRLRLAMLLAALSGFIGLSYEILWVRVYAFVSWGKAHSFGVLLGAYLAGLAVGALVARAYCGARERAPLRGLAVFLLAANVLGFVVVPGVAEAVRVVSYGWALPAFGLVAALLGTALPLIAHFGIAPDDRVGSRLGYVYVANILGAAAGSLLTGFVLLDVLSIGGISVVLLWCGVAVAGGLFWADGARRRAVAAGLLGVSATLVAPSLFDGVWERLQLKADYVPGTRFPHVVENRSGVITVTADGLVSGDGAYDGRFSTDPVDDVNGIFRVYALGAFREAPRSALVVGLGTGSWAQVLAHFDTIERLVVIEINPGYVDLLETAPAVASLRTNPKVTFVVDDGRRWLHRHDEKFDLVVQNTTYHFRAHATNLLSREYLELVRNHLTDGGAFLYNTTKSKDAQRTALAVYPHAWRIGSAMLVSDAPLDPDRARYRTFLETFAIDGRRVFDLPEDRAALTRLTADDRWNDRKTVEQETRHAKIVTDNNMATEW